jgi:hypothetical protein
LRNNPELQNLRMLQALNSPQGRAAPSLVLGAGPMLPVRAADETAPPEPPPANP